MSVNTRTRLSAADRKEQLLALGVRLFSRRSIDEVSIDLLAEEAGISRGLLYHYFGNKRDFRRAVVRHAADDLIAQTAPAATGDPLSRLLGSMGAYVDYVVDNLAGYESLVQAARSGDPELQAIYDEARRSLTDRIFDQLPEERLVLDTPAVRMVVDAWSAFAEELTLAWARDPSRLSRADLLAVLTGSLPALADLV